jgi:hypothetical protein
MVAQKPEVALGASGFFMLAASDGAAGTPYTRKLDI